MKLLLIALLASWIGCGCGGGTATTQVVPLSSTVAQFENGWTWNYAFKGTFTPTGATQYPAVGSRTVTCSVGSPGAVTLTETTLITANETQYSHTKTFSYTQGADGSLALVNETVDENPTETVQTSPFVQPGKIIATTDVSGLITFQDSTTEPNVFDVTGIQLVPTEVGKIETWEISRQVTYQNQTLVKVSEFLAPTLGEPVELSGSWIVSDGSYTGTFLLNSTTAPIPSGSGVGSTTQVP
jgi:hypothetical protein